MIRATSHPTFALRRFFLSAIILKSLSQLFIIFLDS
jgi:hypothetical protein